MNASLVKLFVVQNFVLTFPWLGNIVGATFQPGEFAQGCAFSRSHSPFSFLDRDTVDPQRSCFTGLTKKETEHGN